MTHLRSLFLVALAVLAHSLGAVETHRVAAPGIGPMPWITSSVSVAFGPEGGLAVWSVGSGPPDYANARTIWAVPLNLDGHPTGLARLILTDARGAGNPVLQYFGGSFMLWWHNGPPAVTKTARLRSDGSLIEAGTTLSVQASPVAFSSRLALAFGRLGSDLAVHFFDAGNTVVRSAPLTGVGNPYYYDAVALADGSFAVVTTDWSGLFLTRFSEDGQQIGGPLLLDASRGTTSTAYRPHAVAVATDGSTLLVVWTAGAFEQLKELKSVLVTRDNVLLSPLIIDQRPQWRTIGPIHAEWADGNYTVAVEAGQFTGAETDDLDLYAARFAATGRMASDAFVPVLKQPGLDRLMTMRTSNRKHLLFFSRGHSVMQEIFFLAVPTSGSLSRSDPGVADGRLSDSAAWQISSVAASDGSGWLVVWIERLANREEIRSVSLRPDGGADVSLPGD